ncbi:hypothetical protein AB7Y49_12090 [Providencia vermicola]|uniref:Adhesin n=3 Tax=Providencia TaxID=586 RepID=A0ABD5LA48_PROST|nr:MULTISPECIES: hypothetical protein [Providencia]ELR5045925.1 hypothetical protein [Providencia rettgeri]ELR5122948.1 hypothetical protein [Providencia stuartii]ELR5293251.1 hypothetical protein [Providencia stuartii]ELX8379862.1 hypothetical protein [Providencia stuartii]ELZ5941065.1 hypothetical protein [Providencia stuartii]
MVSAKSKIYRKLSVMTLLMGLSSGQVHAEMNIILDGLLDLDIPKAPSDPYLVEARLTGRTYLSTQGTYGNHGFWDQEWALVGLTSSGTYCQKENSGFVVSIPGTNKKGFALDFYLPDGTKPSGAEAWIIPTINYNVSILGSDEEFNSQWRNLERNYTGTFFRPTPGLVDTYTRANICMYPSRAYQQAYDTTRKYITFNISEKFELYTNFPMRPGRFQLQKVVYVRTDGPRLTPHGAKDSERLQFETNIRVVRICKIKNVTQSTFDIVMGRNNQETRESRFQYTCTADNKPIYITAIPREGRVDSNNPRKLWFNKVDGTELDNSKSPWLLALPYKDGDDSTLLCSNETNTKLMKFNNSDQAVGQNSVSNKDESLNIKWAICANDNVDPGKYRARVEVAVYTKI